MSARQLQTALDQGIGADRAGFIPLGAEMESLSGECPSDLFRRTEEGQFVLVVGRGLPLESEVRGRLKRHGRDSLFVREEDAELYFRKIARDLSALAKDPSVPVAGKTRLLHASCQAALQRLFTDPRALFVEQVHETILPMVDLVLEDESATQQLFRLTSYDHATYVHSVNVGIFALALAKIFFGRSAEHDLHRIGAGFFLHDLGKCRTPWDLINKPGPLSAEERVVINRHPEDGLRLLEESGRLTEEAEIIILQHHERDDGSGYPYGLRGEAIHPYARICRLADVYEALTANRPYQARRSTFQALKIMREQILADTDPDLMGNFIRLFAG